MVNNLENTNLGKQDNEEKNKGDEKEKIAIT